MFAVSKRHVWGCMTEVRDLVFAVFVFAVPQLRIEAESEG